MEKTDLQLLNRIFQDAQVGMLSIDKVLKKIENEKLKGLFKKQFEMYEKFGEKCNILAVSEDEEIAENGFFKKFKQTTMIYFSLWTDKTPRHIVEMMINGTVMGIVDAIKAEKDFKTKNEEVKKLVVEFKQMQEDFYEKLKKQLAKV